MHNCKSERCTHSFHDRKASPLSQKGGCLLRLLYTMSVVSGTSPTRAREGGRIYHPAW